MVVQHISICINLKQTSGVLSPTYYPQKKKIHQKMTNVYFDYF
jgi:hypothetical protein